MARPSKLTPETRVEIVTLVQGGIPLKEAAEQCGVSSSSFFAWLAKGRQELNDGVEDTETARLALGIRKGKSRQLQAAMNVINKAINSGKEDTARWLLERRFPDYFAARTKTETVTSDMWKHELEWLAGQMSESAFLELLDALTRRQQEQQDE